MESETDDPEKGQLLEKSQHHREALEEEMKLMTEKTEKVLTNALIIAGALTVTYLLVRGLSGSSSKKKKEKARKIKLVAGAADSEEEEEDDEPARAGIASQIGGVIAAQVTGLLLSIAREKLVEFLESHYGAKNERTNERP